MSHRTLRILGLAILIVGAFVMIFPTVWMLMVSFHEYPERFRTVTELIKEPWTLRNYLDALTTDNFGRFFANSLLVATAVTAGM